MAKEMIFELKESELTVPCLREPQAEGPTGSRFPRRECAYSFQEWKESQGSQVQGVRDEF
jgi:hypothetical protein